MPRTMLLLPAALLALAMACRSDKPCDVDEDCGPDAVCRPLGEEGSSVCRCKEGFTGNGRTCTDARALWSEEFGVGGDHHASAAIADWRGYLYVAGSTDGALFSNRQLRYIGGFVTAYDGTGALRWSAAYDPEMTPPYVPSVRFHVLAAGGQESLYAGGWHDNGQENVRALVVRFDERSGTTRWARTLGDGGYTSVTAVAGAPEGAYAGGLAWTRFEGQPTKGEFDGFIVRLALDGTVQWFRLLAGSSGSTSILALASDDEEHLYVVGRSPGPLEGGQRGGLFVARYDPEGNRMWLYEPGASGGRSSVRLDGRGTLWVLVSPLTGQTARLIQLTTGGHHLQTVTLPDMPDALFNDLAIDSDGSLLVGVSEGERSALTPLSPGNPGTVGTGAGFVLELDDEGELSVTHEVGGVEGTKVTAVAQGNGLRFAVGNQFVPAPEPGKRSTQSFFIQRF